MNLNVKQIIATASNVKVGENPPFSLDDFYKIYPQFQSLTEISQDVKDMYLSFANECVRQTRWNIFKLECLYSVLNIIVARMIKCNRLIAIYSHFLTLHLQSYSPSNATAREVIANAQTKGLISSKSVGDVSVSYDFSQAVEGLDSWGQWKATAFGIQFANYAKLLGRGGKMIW